MLKFLDDRRFYYENLIFKFDFIEENNDLYILNLSNNIAILKISTNDIINIGKMHGLLYLSFKETVEELCVLFKKLIKCYVENKKYFSQNDSKNNTRS